MKLFNILLTLLVCCSTEAKYILTRTQDNPGVRLGDVTTTVATRSDKTNVEKEYDHWFFDWLRQLVFWEPDPTNIIEINVKVVEKDITSEKTRESGPNFVKSRHTFFYLERSSSDQTREFQNLINQMNEYDKIILKRGDHYLSGTVHINRPSLTIVGEEGSIIRKSGAYSAIDLDKNSNKTTMENIYIDGGNLEEPCMRVYSSHNHIVGSTFRNSGNSGLLLHGSNFNIIESCKLNYNYMVGLSQWDSRNNQIINCQMFENGAEGLTVDGHSHNSKIHHNWIHKNNLLFRGVGAIGIDASNGVKIYKNTIDYNGLNGITFQNNLCGGCDNAKIYENDINFNIGAAIGKRYNDQPIDNLVVHGNREEFNLFVEQITIPDKKECIPVELCFQLC